MPDLNRLQSPILPPIFESLDDFRYRLLMQ